MGREKLVFGLGAACVAGCAIAAIAPLLLGLGLAGWQFGAAAALTLLVAGLTVRAIRRRSRIATICRVDGGCGCQSGKADSVSTGG